MSSASSKGLKLNLPLSLLRGAINHPLLVELKNGETYNGHLKNCDNWMNIHLCEVICTSKDGTKFTKMPECYIRGNTIKYFILVDEVLQSMRDETRLEKKAHSLPKKPAGMKIGSKKKN
ncbi:putative U6 snRNA-associated Sm-like protein LSm4 [Intoshia linei]|uniref:U6 snRNA-associated Sm-like protein LSm4 n=1 Tax=Intoshia linei TaxID=1819745 RepID=A0A177BAW9_9BILA|nr:putative U6 snRNA-associated Sm-like protein LSm4 [Intoshia linei]